jgi:hypothetical protein
MLDNQLLRSSEAKNQLSRKGNLYLRTENGSQRDDPPVWIH